MSYPFETKKEISSFAGYPIEHAKKVPEFNGVEIKEYRWVKVYDKKTDKTLIKYLHENLGRMYGSRKESHVGYFVTVFKSEKYEPFFNEPIVIDEDGTLICGRHRIEGAIIAGTEWVWAAIVKFENNVVKRKYAISENLTDTSGAKLGLDEEELIELVATAFTETENLKTNAISVRKYLDEIGAKNIENKGKVIDDILGKCGKVTTEKAESPPLDEIINYLEDKLGVTESDISCGLWKIFTFRTGVSGAAGDRKLRFLKSITPRLIKGLDINVVVKYSETSPENLNAARALDKINLVKDYVDTCCAVADAKREGRLGKVNLYFTKATKKEYKKGNMIVEVE